MLNSHRWLAAPGLAGAVVQHFSPRRNRTARGSTGPNGPTSPGRRGGGILAATRFLVLSFKFCKTCACATMYISLKMKSLSCSILPVDPAPPRPCLRLHLSSYAISSSTSESGLEPPGSSRYFTTVTKHTVSLHTYWTGYKATQERAGSRAGIKHSPFSPGKLRHRELK